MAPSYLWPKWLFLKTFDFLNINNKKTQIFQLLEVVLSKYQPLYLSGSKLFSLHDAQYFISTDLPLLWFVMSGSALIAVQLSLLSLLKFPLRKRLQMCRLRWFASLTDSSWSATEHVYRGVPWSCSDKKAGYQNIWPNFQIPDDTNDAHGIRLCYSLSWPVRLYLY